MANKDEITEIKKLLKENKLIIGTDNTIKNLKKGQSKKIWLSSNTPEEVEEDIKNYSNMSDVELVALDLPNDELGVLCKKQFAVSVLSVAKGEN